MTMLMFRDDPDRDSSGNEGHRSLAQTEGRWDMSGLVRPQSARRSKRENQATGADPTTRQSTHLSQIRRPVDRGPRECALPRAIDQVTLVSFLPTPIA